MALSGISVVLCCARSDEPHLSVVVEHLRRESIEPLLLSGVEEDAHRLGSAVDNERGRALFVMCKSSVLGPADVLRLEGIFGARKGPQHRFVAARLRPDDPLGMLKEIRAAIAGFSSSKSSMEDSDEDHGSMREVVVLSGISAVGSSQRGGEVMRERLASRETPADPIAIPMRGKAAEHAARVPPHQSGSWHQNGDVGDTLSEKKSPLAPDASRQGPPPASLLPEPSPPRNAALMPALVGGLVVAVLGLGAVVLTRPGASTADARPDTPLPVTASPRPAPTALPAGPAPAKPIETPAPVPAPGLDGDGDAGVAADSGSGETGEDSAGTDPHPLDVEAAIAEAIANGEMRALDLLLVGAPDGERPWRKAVDHCRRKRVNGVNGWRLPTLPELKKLRSARMLKQGRYWSSTRGAGELDDVYVFDRTTRKVELVAKDDEQVTALCVRPR